MEYYWRHKQIVIKEQHDSFMKRTNRLAIGMFEWRPSANQNTKGPKLQYHYADECG